MNQPVIGQRKTRRRGNPNWGRPVPPIRFLATEFELTVKRLHLTPEMYAASSELKRWCQQNRNRCYIPEVLLQTWDIAVEFCYGDDAA